MNKMNWLSDSIKSGSHKYRISETREVFGTIKMPTGDGKSGVIIEDIIYHILNRKDNETLVLNVSSPILKLNQQLLNDLFETLSELDIDTSDIRFFINSSDSGKNYENIELTETTADNLSEFDGHHSKVNIVASCHPSLYKFQAFLVDHPNIKAISYWDEAHKVNASDEELKVENKIDISNYCENSAAVYAVSATPNEYITMCLREQSIFKKDYVIEVTPRESISKGNILPPYVKYFNLGENATLETNASTLDIIMKDARTDNPNISHKILVTCGSREQILLLDKQLSRLGCERTLS